MGYWKKFQMFCQEHRLRTDKQSSHDAYEADCRGLSFQACDTVEINDEHQVSWNEITIMTGGRSGIRDTRCPYCGWDKEKSNQSFRIDCTLIRAEWRCFYCGVNGVTVNPEGVPSTQNHS